MTTSDLTSEEFNPYYLRYLDKLSKETSLRKGFEIGKITVLNFFTAIPEEKWSYRYAEGKWSVKEVLQHLIDTERIFMYRCFRIARHDKTSLAGYDQNIYIEPSAAANKTVNQLIEEFKVTRNYSISLLNSLRDEDLQHIGNANDSAMSARAAAFTIIGHDIWHMDVVKDKYL